MHLDHTFACKTFAQRNHFTFWLKQVLRPTFRSANWLSEVKSKSLSRINVCCVFPRLKMRVLCTFDFELSLASFIELPHDLFVQCLVLPDEALYERVDRWPH